LPATLPGSTLELLSRQLQQLHGLLLAEEKQFHPPVPPLALLDRLMNDPAWAWLRGLSTLIADIDHVLAQPEAATEYDLAVVAAHARALLSGEGDAGSTWHDRDFIERYRALLQLSPALIAIHGEIKRLLKGAPAESEDEAQRLHARHQWAMRCQHRATKR
jgi:hypothetical protein